MRIDKAKCTECGQCADYCIMSCIVRKGDAYVIEEDECVDCGACLKSRVCPQNAIYMPIENYEFPRCVRMQFSDPGVKHPKLQAWGRGIEHDKTNDVLGKFKRGEYCLMLEVGRPLLGVRLKEIEKLLVQLIGAGFALSKDNPLWLLAENAEEGRLKKEVLNEKILNATIEIKLTDADIENALKTIIPMLNGLDTVVSVGLLTRFDDDGGLPVLEKLKNMNITVRPNAKINVGLGRPLSRE